MAQTVVDLTLSTLRDLLVKEAEFLAGVAGHVSDVQTELRRLQIFLEDVDQKKYVDPNVVNYVKEIRDLCYRIEDVVEAYATDVVLQKSENAQSIIEILSRIISRLCGCVPAHEVGTEIIRIKESISKLYESMVNYGFIKSTLGTKEKSDEVDGQKKWLGKTYGLEVNKYFVGMEKDITLLVAELINGEESVVSICGMGGLGKTTLAEKIYWDKGIRSGFEAFAWVCVSQVCNPRSVFQDLLEQLCQITKQTTEGMGDSMLVQEVYGALQELKCLVVLDDVWELEHWRCLSPAFPAAEASSKILITTRKENVAKIGFFHPLGLLSSDEAWELLQKNAFARTDPKDLRLEPKILEQVGRKIVHKCGYLPLAISVIGGILNKNVSLKAWETVSDKIDVYLRRADGSEGDGRVRQVLSLSYDDLPFHLKPCFLYLSRFQEDEIIRARELYSIWIAEGIVSAKEGEELIDVAEQYLQELAARSIVLAREGEGEEEVSYRLHDLLRDLCLAKSAEEEFLQVVDFRGGKRPTLSPTSSSTSSSHFPRRLAVYMDSDVDGVSLTSVGDDSTQKLRSLLLRGPSFRAQPDLSRGLIELEKLKFLKVLGFRFVSFTGKDQLLEGLGGLVHLRFLSFQRCSSPCRLPSCIGDLPSLQALELDFIYRRNLIDQRHARTTFQMYRIRVPSATLLGLDESQNLEVMDLPTLKGLRRLRVSITRDSDLSKFLDSIERCPRLEETVVFYSSSNFGSEKGMAILRKLFMSRNVHHIKLFSTDGDVHEGKLPDYEPGFFPNLTLLHLEIKGISRDPMATLEKLPKLRSLFLDESYNGEEMSCSAEGFPQLRSLRLKGLPNLKAWKVEEGAMPCLSFLRLEGCDRLETIPEGIKFITTLQTLHVGQMPYEFKCRVGETGPDFGKVRHVNYIIFGWE